MALSFFGLIIFLILTLDSDYSPSPSYAASKDVQSTYGSRIKLMHEKTKARLHSQVPYGSSSEQQSVIGFPGVDDANSYWIVKPGPDTSAKQGDAIKSGSIIRLQHMMTPKGKNVQQKAGTQSFDGRPAKGLLPADCNIESFPQLGNFPSD